MKKFLSILVLSLLWCNTVLAQQSDSSKNFQIEGISIGDSALIHFSKEEIKNNTESGYYANIKKDPGKFIAVEFQYPGTGKYKFKKKFELYEAVQISYKKGDSNYVIHQIRGMIKFTNNIEDCYIKQKEIDKELSIIFKNLKRETDKSVHEGDPSGKSTIREISYWFPNNDVAGVDCYDWSDEIGFLDHIRVGIVTNELNSWLLEE